MAIFNEYILSNNFKVENIDEFKKELSKMGGTSFFEFFDDKVRVATDKLLVNFVNENDGSNHYICYVYDDYSKLIQDHMCSDQKVFINSIGCQKSKYLTADCRIITKDDIVHYDFFNMMGKEFNDEHLVF